MVDWAARQGREFPLLPTPIPASMPRSRCRLRYVPGRLDGRLVACIAVGVGVGPRLRSLDPHRQTPSCAGEGCGCALPPGGHGPAARAMAAAPARQGAMRQGRRVSTESGFVLAHRDDPVRSRLSLASGRAEHADAIAHRRESPLRRRDRRMIVPCFRPRAMRSCSALAPACRAARGRRDRSGNVAAQASCRPCRRGFPDPGLCSRRQR